MTLVNGLVQVGQKNGLVQVGKKKKKSYEHRVYIGNFYESVDDSSLS